MLTEEALIVLAAFGACGLVILGVLELLWPTRPKHTAPPRRPAVPRVARPHRQSALTRHTRDRGQTPYLRRQAPLAPSPVPLAPLAPAVRAVTAPIEPVADASIETLIAEPLSPAPAADEIVALQTVASEPVVLGAPTPSGDADMADALDRGEPEPGEPELAEPMLAEPVLAAAPEPEAAPDISLPGAGESVVEICFALYQEQRYDEVIERGAGALTAAGPLTEPREKAALWSVVALARQALGEDPLARTALENAIAQAPDAERPTYQRQLASLARSVAEGLMAEARQHASPDSEDCLGMLRSAVAWLERGAAAAPDDAVLPALIADAETMLWRVWQRTVMTLAQRQEFRAARRLLREALADPRFPAALAENFKELFSGTFSGEIGQLTAQAIRSMQEARESDALASLQRAESLLDTLNAEALPPSRREEVDRRLWWGYNKLGARRVETAQHESALEPLFHALTYDVGPARRQETVALLARALDGVADARALTMRELADAGDREAALVQCDKLWALLRSAGEMGVSQADLASTFTKVQRLFDQLRR